MNAGNVPLFVSHELREADETLAAIAAHLEGLLDVIEDAADATLLARATVTRLEKMGAAPTYDTAVTVAADAEYALRYMVQSGVDPQKLMDTIAECIEARDALRQASTSFMRGRLQLQGSNLAIPLKVR